MSSLKEFAKLLKEAQEQKKEEKALDNFSKLLKETKLSAPPKIEPEPVLETILEETILSDTEIVLEEDLNEDITINDHTVTQEITSVIEDIVEEISPIEKVAKAINSKKINENIETERWNDPLRREPNEKFVTFKELNDHYTNFLGRIQQQLSSLGGSGEVKFRYLDDVNRSTMLDSNDNWVLEYDAATKKVQFTKDIGKIDSVWFDPEHIDNHENEGVLCWNALDKTLNISHQNGVKQQIGQETYFLVKNVTGFEIPNGTFCMFAGVTENGINRLDAAPFLADGTYPNLYGIGVATENIADGEIGFVTNFGMVRGLDTTGSDVNETWSVGDILYANPLYNGKLTRVKPTAPNNVLPVAAVVKVDETAGEIFVRPTFEQKTIYARFIDTTTHTPALINTPYAITWDTTVAADGVSIGTPSSRIYVSQSGLFQLDISLSLTSTNSSAKIFYAWLRKNGQDVVYTSRRQSVVGNGTYDVLTMSYSISLNANEYIEIMYAANDTTISIDAPVATAFCPAFPSATIKVFQAAL